jgi:hypothetical protein
MPSLADQQLATSARHGQFDDEQLIRPDTEEAETLSVNVQHEALAITAFVEERSRRASF